MAVRRHVHLQQLPVVVERQKVPTRPRAQIPHVDGEVMEVFISPPAAERVILLHEQQSSFCRHGDHVDWILVDIQLLLFLSAYLIEIPDFYGGVNVRAGRDEIRARRDGEREPINAVNHYRRKMAAEVGAPDVEEVVLARDHVLPVVRERGSEEEGFVRGVDDVEVEAVRLVGGHVEDDEVTATDVE